MEKVVQLRGDYGLQLKTVSMALVFFSILNGSGLSQDPKLHKDWVTMAEAATNGYYRGKYHSSGMQLGAVCRTPEIARTSRPRLQAAAESILSESDFPNRKKFALGRSGKLIDARWTELKAALGELIGPSEDMSGEAWMELKQCMSPFGLVDGGEEAMMKWSDICSGINLDGVWEEYLLPFRVKSCLEEADSKLISVELASDCGNRRVWSICRNISGKPLENVVLVLRPREIGRPIEDQWIFVKEWPANERILPDTFRTHTTGGSVPSETPDKALQARFEVWSDQGHNSLRQAKSVGFYDLRDSITPMMVHTGARYVCVHSDFLALFEFTKVIGGKESQSVEASLKILPRNSNSTKIDKRYKGIWTNKKSKEPDYSAAVEILIDMEEVGIPIAVSKASQKRNKADSSDSTIRFRWDREFFKLDLPDNPNASRFEQSPILQLHPIPDVKKN